MIRFSPILLVPLFVALAGSAYAIEAIPEEAGWSGHLRLGAGGFSVKTNMISGINKSSTEVGDAKIDSLDDGPDSMSTPVPQFNLNLKYTFSTQTQVFVGNSLEDIVQLDLVQVFGVRQQFSDRSILEVSAVASPSFAPVQVWEDPYVVGEDREETDRNSRGFRLEYDKILGSGFGLRFTQRETEIDDEFSGTTQLGLSNEQAALLDREGDTTNVAVSYAFKPVGRNLFSLRLGISDHDLDGEAMAGDSNQFQLTYVHLGDRFITAINGTFISKEYDASNPVFDKTRDDDGFGLAILFFDKGLFDSKDWWGQATVMYIEQDSNIDFYDQSAAAVILGVQRNF
jgi:hypothetical protein